MIYVAFIPTMFAKHNEQVNLFAYFNVSQTNIPTIVNIFKEPNANWNSLKLMYVWQGTKEQNAQENANP